MDITTIVEPITNIIVIMVPVVIVALEQTAKVKVRVPTQLFSCFVENAFEAISFTFALLVLVA